MCAQFVSQVSVIQMHTIFMSMAKDAVIYVVIIKFMLILSVVSL